MIRKSAIATADQNPKRNRESEFVAYLRQNDKIDMATAQRILLACEQTNQPIETIILELGFLEEGALADEISTFLGFERIKAAEFPESFPVHEKMPLEYLELSQIVPLEISASSVTIAVAHAIDDTSIRGLAYFLDLEAVVRIATSSDLSKMLSSLGAGQSTDSQGLAFDQSPELLGTDIDRLRDVASEAPIIKLFGRLVSAAVEQRASDIHIEPMESHVRVRNRIDGSLLEVETISKEFQLGLTSRIKILAKLNIAENRLPQDGRIRMAVKGKEIDFRVSTSPTTYGESVVLRILDQRQVALDFGELGFDEKAIALLNRTIQQPNGVILVTGPTGSGKTTTLYGALDVLNSTQSKLFTIEDPIEYNMKGVNQILVRPQIGLDFAHVLRSILRQDPDVIMIGEIRDSETAKIAVQAALTGHLVLSTLHTNSAASTITRLRDIGVDSFLMASTLRLIIAQRLVRKLCNKCKVLEKSIGNGEPISSFKAVGCKACNQTGYLGRTVIYELLEISESIRSEIAKETSDEHIDQLARNAGLKSLYECGISKVKSGETSMQEIHRVARDGI